MSPPPAFSGHADVVPLQDPIKDPVETPVDSTGSDREESEDDIPLAMLHPAVRTAGMPLTGAAQQAARTPRRRPGSVPSSASATAALRRGSLAEVARDVRSLRSAPSAAGLPAGRGRRKRQAAVAAEAAVAAVLKSQRRSI